MNKEDLTKLWKWVSVGCFAYGIGSLISIQRGVDVFGAKLFADLEKDGREVLAYFAVIVGTGLTSLALAVANALRASPWEHLAQSHSGRVSRKARHGGARKHNLPNRRGRDPGPFCPYTASASPYS
jgi:hypothetical protein